MTREGRMEKKNRMAARILFLFINSAITASNTVKAVNRGEMMDAKKEIKPQIL
jgi:hypothetical protein